MSAVPMSPPTRGAELVRLGDREFWSTGGRVARFIESRCIHTNARWLGQPFRLMAWQRRLLYELFEVDPASGLRVYRFALLGLPRKSGKTELLAAILLYLMLADGEVAAEGYCAAASEEQADRLFDAAKRMCEEIEGRPAPPLAAYVDVSVGKLVSRTDPYSFIERLSGKGKTKHGLNVHAVGLDEFHVWGAGEQAELWSALTTGSAARLQPLQIAITTAGTDLDGSRCGAMYRLGRRIEAGEVDHGGMFFRWWAAPEHRCRTCRRDLYGGDACPDHPTATPRPTDYRDPEMWRLASPSYGHTVTEGFYRLELTKTTEQDFRRLYLNQWVEDGATPWLQPGQWQACDIGPFEFVEGAPTWVGVDLSESRDSTAVAVGQMVDDVLRVRVRTWEVPLGADGKPRSDWQVPQAEVKEHIRELAERYDVLTIVFDPWHSKLMRQDLEAEGLPVEEIWQTGARRSGATAALYDRIVTQRIAHDGDPVLARHVANATTKPAGEGYYLAKRKQGRVMDAAMTLVNVVYGTMFAHPAAPTWHGIYIPGGED